MKCNTVTSITRAYLRCLNVMVLTFFDANRLASKCKHRLSRNDVVDMTTYTNSLQAHCLTEIRFTIGLFAWVSFLVILISGVFIMPLFFLWVPFIVNTFKDAHHYCSNCKAWIGTYRRLGKSV